MARRRSLDGMSDDFEGSNPFESNSLGSEGGPGIGGILEMLPDLKLPEGEPPPDGTQIGVPGPDESGPEGNTTTARELFPQDRPTGDGLPQGMTVQGEQGYGDEFGGGGGGMEAFSTPGQSYAPSPISAMRPNPAVAETRRVSPGGAPSALFSDASGGTPMFGRMGGLDGGGRGVLGANAGGPAPTEMMLSLLRMLKGGG